MKSNMKSKAAGLLLLSLMTVSILAFAGCQDSSTKSTDTTKKTTDTTKTTTDTKTTDTKATDTKATDTKATDTKATDTKATDTKATDTKATATTKVEVPSTAEGKQEASVMGNNVTTYKTKDTVDKACEAQAALAEKAGWKKGSTMPAPVKANGAWSMIYENGDKMLTLACVTDPTSKSTMVSMTEAANALKQ